MAHFPMFIDIRGRRCLVIGGGKVARRKIETLLLYEADVVVISPDIHPEILAMAETSPGRLILDQREADQKLIEEESRQAALVVAASGSRQVNHQTAEICQLFGIPVNVIDEPSECTFLFPAVVKKGDISVGINTGGNSPVLSSRIRQITEKSIPDYYAGIASQLGELRLLLKEKVPEEKKRHMALKMAAAAAFEKEDVLSREELFAILETEGIKVHF